MTRRAQIHTAMGPSRESPVSSPVWEMIAIEMREGEIESLATSPVGNLSCQMEVESLATSPVREFAMANGS